LLKLFVQVEAVADSRPARLLMVIKLAQEKDIAHNFDKYCTWTQIL